MLSLSDINQANIIEVFISTSRSLDDLVGQLCPTVLQLNKSFFSSDTEAPFLDLNLSISNGIVSFKIKISWMI